jgi:hypothetical protein
MCEVCHRQERVWSLVFPWPAHSPLKGCLEGGHREGGRSEEVEVEEEEDEEEAEVEDSEAPMGRMRRMKKEDSMTMRKALTSLKRETKARWMMMKAIGLAVSAGRGMQAMQRRIHSAVCLAFFGFSLSSVYPCCRNGWCSHARHEG